MFRYYLDLALRSFRRDRVLTALMVLAIALGIGASMTTLTVFHVLSADPLPSKSDRTFYVQLDPEAMSGYTPKEEPNAQVTRRDAEQLLREKRGEKQALMAGGEVAVQAADGRVRPFVTDSRYTTADFFGMFETPFQFGGGWSTADDTASARVVVLSKVLNEKLFGGENSTGKTVRLAGTDFRVVGVMDTWRPTPRFYDINGPKFGNTEDIFAPFSTSRDLKLGFSGSMDCWSDEGANVDQFSLEAKCTWMQYWVQLKDSGEATKYRQYITDYSDQQRASGRFERPTNVRVRSIMEHLRFNKVVPEDVRLQVWLAFGFLVVCLVNTVGLLLAKCLRRAPEIGVRRALGAPRRSIFAQFVVEAGLIGLAGGISGLLLAMLGLWGIRHNPAEYSDLAHLDWKMFVITFALAIGASLLAGLLPAWRACQVTPALQLKSQ